MRRLPFYHEKNTWPPLVKGIKLCPKSGVAALRRNSGEHCWHRLAWVRVIKEGAAATRLSYLPVHLSNCDMYTNTLRDTWGSFCLW